MSDEKTTVKLLKPIKGLDGIEISKLELKEPTGEHLVKYGIPVDKNGQVDFKKAFDLIEALSGIQLPVLKQLSPKDSIRAVRKVADFYSIGEDDLGD